MIQKKKLIILSLVGVITMSATIIASAYFNKNYSENIKYSYELVKNKDGIEHIKKTYDNGYMDIYRDTKNLLEQVDEYDKDGILITRSIYQNDDENTLTIAKDPDGTYLGSDLKVSKAIALDNKELLKKPTIENFSHDDIELDKNIEWKKSISNDRKIIKYSSDNVNLYIDKKSNEFIKREMFMDGKLNETIDYNVIDRNSKKGMQLFKVNSKFSSSKMSSINFDNIKITKFR